MISAEIKWNLNSSDKFLSDLGKSDFMKSVAERLNSEITYDQKVRSEVTSAGMAMFLGAMSGSPMSTLQNLPSMMASMQNVTQNASRMYAAFGESFGDVGKAQYQTAITVNGEQVEIQANNLAELRAGFRKILAQHSSLQKQQ